MADKLTSCRPTCSIISVAQFNQKKWNTSNESSKTLFGQIKTRWKNTTTISTRRVRIGTKINEDLNKKCNRNEKFSYLISLKWQQNDKMSFFPRFYSRCLRRVPVNGNFRLFCRISANRKWKCGQQKWLRFKREFQFGWMRSYNTSAIALALVCVWDFEWVAKRSTQRHKFDGETAKVYQRPEPENGETFDNFKRQFKFISNH